MESQSAAGRKYRKEMTSAHISPRWLSAVLSIFAHMAQFDDKKIVKQEFLPPKLPHPHQTAHRVMLVCLNINTWNSKTSFRQKAPVVVEEDSNTLAAMRLCG